MSDVGVCAGAIETCPSEFTEQLSQFYQNRAAAWESLVGSSGKLVTLVY